MFLGVPRNKLAVIKLVGENFQAQKKNRSDGFINSKLRLRHLEKHCLQSEKRSNKKKSYVFLGWAMGTFLDGLEIKEGYCLGLVCVF